MVLQSGSNTPLVHGTGLSFDEARLAKTANVYPKVNSTMQWSC